jgi:hypothetical protein
MAKAKARARKAKSGSFLKERFRDVQFRKVPCEEVDVLEVWSGPKPIGVASKPAYIVGPPAVVKALMRLVRKGMG